MDLTVNRYAATVWNSLPNVRCPLGGTCHSQRSEEARKYFCPLWKWLRFGSNRGVGRGYRKTTRTWERWIEEERTTNVLGKDYDTERRLFGGNGYRDLPGACTVEISIDSQLGRIPGVVSTPMPHPHLLTLPSQTPTTFSFSFLLSFRGSKSFLLLFTDIPAEMVSYITVPLSSAFHFWSPFSSSTFLYLYTRAFFLFSDDARLSTRRSRTAPKLAQWISNKRIHLGKFQFPVFARGTTSRILVTSRIHIGLC